MLEQHGDVERRIESEPIELSPTDLHCVAGGAPTLPLPPPARFNPDPVPW
jgi:hypothetical protein